MRECSSSYCYVQPYIILNVVLMPLKNSSAPAGEHMQRLSVTRRNVIVYQRDRELLTVPLS